MSPSPVLRLAAFTDSPEAGNPAGVLLDARGLPDDEMLAIARDVGYSETAFLMPAGAGTWDVRYFSPVAEVPFCGHATVAAGVALAREHGPGEFRFETRSGPVPVVTARAPDGTVRATLTSVAAHVDPVAAEDLAEALAALGWPEGDLDAALPPRVAYAGARHLILAAATRGRLAALEYDVPRLRALMESLGWTTVALVWRESPLVLHARNPFPVGGVYEDPATGAAAAALGAYLRELGLVTPPAELTIHQGEDLGRPGTLHVALRAGRREVDVSGTAVEM